MKKTTSIHIKGIHFIIEEDAYETLKLYMERLNQKLVNANGKEEIIEDIELRIAELFNECLKNGKQVIDEADVEKTIATLGEPEEYIDEEFDNASSSESSSTNANRESDIQHKKKLYRDIDNASIAGVCAGLAVYFNIEVILIRILFILLVIGGGFGIPLYIVLWIVLPTANSHIDRLRMKGKAITVETVQAEVELAAERLTQSSKNLQTSIQSGTIHHSINRIGRLISKLIGFFLLLVGLAMSVFFVFVLLAKQGVFPVQDDHGMLTPYQFGELLLEPSLLSQVWWTAGILISVFIVYFVASAMRFILNYRYPWYKHLTRFTIVVTVLAVIYGFYLATNVTREFSVESEIKKEVLTTNEKFNIQFQSEGAMNSEEQNIRSNKRAWFFIKKNRIMDEDYYIQVRTSKDSLFHVFYVKSANGHNTASSLARAKAIQFPIDFQLNTLKLPEHFSYPRKDKIRHQQLRVYIEIPPGQSITLNDKIYYPQEDSYSIYNPNCNNHWDEDDWD